MNDPGREAKARDFEKIYQITGETAALPLPFAGPDRASFYFIDRDADAARRDVETAKRVFAGAFGVTFRWRDLWTGNGTRRQYKATLLPSGLDLVLMAKAAHMQDEDDAEGAGVRELAEVAAR